MSKSPPVADAPEPVLLIIADISGYTRYMTANAKTLAHSQSIITELVEVIVRQVELPLEVAKLEGDTIVTTFQVKNMSASNAIVGLQISEFWYDKAGNPLQGTGDRQRLRTPLQPLDVATIVLKSPKVTGMATPQYKFEQNNGTVKPVSMKQAKVLKPGTAS